MGQKTFNATNYQTTYAPQAGYMAAGKSSGGKMHTATMTFAPLSVPGSIQSVTLILPWNNAAAGVGFTKSVTHRATVGGHDYTYTIGGASGTVRVTIGGYSTTANWTCTLQGLANNANATVKGYQKNIRAEVQYTVAKPAAPEMAFGNGGTVYQQRPRMALRCQTAEPLQSAQVQWRAGQTLSAQTNGAHASWWSRTSPLTQGQTFLIRPGQDVGTGSCTLSGTVQNAEQQSDARTQSCTVVQPQFTDASLQAGQTPVKAAHIQELQNMIHALQTYFGVSHTTWADGVETGKPIQAVHVQQLRTAVEGLVKRINEYDPYNANNDVSAVPWGQQSVQSEQRIAAAHIQQLRTMIQSL